VRVNFAVKRLLGSAAWSAAPSRRTTSMWFRQLLSEYKRHDWKIGSKNLRFLNTPEVKILVVFKFIVFAVNEISVSEIYFHIFCHDFTSFTQRK